MKDLRSSESNGIGTKLMILKMAEVQACGFWSYVSAVGNHFSAPQLWPKRQGG
jgi:hypothetical protein